MQTKAIDYKNRMNQKNLTIKFCFAALLTLAIIQAGCNPDPDAKYSVTYLGNGNTYGFAPVDNNRYLYGDKAVVKEKGSLQKEDKEFQNWNTKKDGDGDSYHGGETITVMGAVFLYAIWE